MLLHLVETVEVALTCCSLSQVCAALSLGHMLSYLRFRDGQVAELALLHVLDAEVVVQLKRLLGVLFTATRINRDPKLVSHVSVIAFISVVVRRCAVM